MKALITSLLSISLVLFSVQVNYAEEASAEKKPEKKKEAVEIVGHTDSVNIVLVTPDGNSVISGSTDKTIRFWDMGKGTATKKVLKGHAGAITAMAETPDGKLLASGSNDYKIKLWNIESGREIKTLTGHFGVINALAFGPGGKILVSGSADGKVKIWDTKSGHSTYNLIGNNGSIYSIAISPDGKIIASGGEDGMIRMWDANSGAEIRSLKGHRYSVQSLVFDKSGKHLASSSWREIKIWDTANGNIARSFTGNEVSGLAFNPAGNVIASGGGYYRKSIKMWNVNTGKMVHELAGNEGAVSTVAFTSDGKTLVSGSDDSRVRFWDVASGKDKFADN